MDMNKNTVVGVFMSLAMCFSSFAEPALGQTIPSAKITKVVPEKGGLGDTVQVFLEREPKTPNKADGNAAGGAGPTQTQSTNPKNKSILFLDRVPLKGIYPDNDDKEATAPQFIT
jgi:hypothetical protein